MFYRWSITFTKKKKIMWFNLALIQILALCGHAEDKALDSKSSWLLSSPFWLHVSLAHCMEKKNYKETLNFPSIPMSILNRDLQSTSSPAVFQTLQRQRSQENVLNRQVSGYALLNARLMVTVQATRNAVETAPECAQLLSVINPRVTKC